MFTISDAFYLALFFTAIGMLIGIGIACWPRSRKSRSFEAPYFKGNGEPQPGVWSPSRAIGHEPVKVYPSIDVWARENGVV